ESNQACCSLEFNSKKCILQTGNLYTIGRFRSMSKKGITLIMRTSSLKRFTSKENQQAKLFRLPLMTPRRTPLALHPIISFT
ncbi:hypothetical protein MRY87_04255, partial [bacterium]|nr:hypothetical protein [bacterium]